MVFGVEKCVKKENNRKNITNQSETQKKRKTRYVWEYWNHTIINRD